MLLSSLLNARKRNREKLDLKLTRLNVNCCLSVILSIIMCVSLYSMEFFQLIGFSITLALLIIFISYQLFITAYPGMNHLSFLFYISPLLIFFCGMNAHRMINNYFLNIHVRINSHFCSRMTSNSN